LCRAYPETVETSSFGHPKFKAGKKTFGAFEVIGERPSIAFRLAAQDAESLLRGRNAFSTPYGRGLWVSVWVDTVLSWTGIERLVDRSYRVVANTRMLCRIRVGAFEERTSEPSTENFEPNLNTN
jgi:predicted DNA-binding protein (MmcQ/YjbR family)